MSDDVEVLLRQMLRSIEALAARVEALEQRGQQGPMDGYLGGVIRALARKATPPPPDLSAKRSAAAKSRWENEKLKLSTGKPTEGTDANDANAMQIASAKYPTITDTSMQSASFALQNDANLQANGARPRRRPVEPTPEGSAAGAKVWLAYAAAYKLRYGVFPVRNAKTNAIIKSFVSRVPMAEAPAVAEFYVGDTEPQYVKSSHALELLLRDAEKLRTAWATGQRVNGHDSLRRAWWEVWSGVEAMGKELGIEQGDNPTKFKYAVLAAALAAGRLPEEAAQKLGIT